MNAIIYSRISSEHQIKLPSQQNMCERVIENGLNFIICHNCGWAGVANTISREEMNGRKSYPKPKCPICK